MQRKIWVKRCVWRTLGLKVEGRRRQRDEVRKVLEVGRRVNGWHLKKVILIWKSTCTIPPKPITLPPIIPKHLPLSSPSPSYSPLPSHHHPLSLPTTNTFISKTHSAILISKYLPKLHSNLLHYAFKYPLQ